MSLFRERLLTSYRLPLLLAVVAVMLLVLALCSGLTASPGAESDEPKTAETEVAGTGEPEETEGPDETAETDEPEEPAETGDAEESDAPGDTGEPGETQEPQETERVPEDLEFEYDSLLTRIPADVREHCEMDPESDERVITAECTMPQGSDAHYVSYGLAVNEEEMSALYDRLLESIGITETDIGSCPEELPAEEAYSIGDHEIGRFACAIDADDVAVIVWTDEPLRIVSYASREDGDIETLYEWWTGPDSGPLQ